MTPRVEAWLRQAHNDLAMAGNAVDGGFHAQACYHASQAAEKALKGHPDQPRPLAAPDPRA